MQKRKGICAIIIAMKTSAKPRSFKVGVFLNRDVEPGRQRVYGVLRFASAHPEWEVTLLPDCPANDSVPTPSHTTFDGIITYALILPDVRRQHPDVPHFAIADWSARPENGSIATVDIDSHKIGECAARYFLRRGFRHFAYVGPFKDRKWSNDREQGFRTAIAAHGYSLHAYNCGSDRDLPDWLEALPKPCAVLAAMDWRARQVAEACRSGGIPVPEQVSVLGVDNDDLLCEFSIPPLSSIELDFERCGYLMAQALDHLMRGGRPPSSPLEYGVRSIVERRSTLDIKGSARIVSLACDFIARNATAPLTLSDIAGAAGCSIRILQKRFADAVGHSPLSELRKRRLALVCDKLIHTTRPITGIGDSCGFVSDAQLKTEFRKAFGMSMRDYRRQRVNEPPRVTSEKSQGSPSNSIPCQ